MRFTSEYSPQHTAESHKHTGRNSGIGAFAWLQSERTLLGTTYVAEPGLRWVGLLMVCVGAGLFIGAIAAWWASD
jgi:hypothetical protein